ncbi:MAG: site-specific tyrosine recombinase XerD [Alphaproteobacteria bacterium]|nr:site-specific tyrosine recombinase XerD [Alphaproteobacteria bacterium]
MIAFLEAFLDMLVAERGVAKNTRAAYEADIVQAGHFFLRRKKNLAQADESELTSYLKSLSGLAPKSRARKLSSLKQYYRFLVSEGHRKDDPTTQQDGPKLNRKLPDVLSIDDMQRLFAATSQATPEAMRMMALLELAYGSGLRVSELMSLPLSAYNAKRKAMLVRGKGDKERLVPLSEPAHTAIAAYLTVRQSFIPKKIKASAYLFPSNSKEGYLSRIRFYQMLKDLAAKAGLPFQKIHPHSLRHAFATHVLSGGADLRSLQQMLGHADIGTTQIYTHVVRDHLQKTVETHHPLAKKRR